MAARRDTATILIDVALVAAGTIAGSVASVLVGRAVGRGGCSREYSAARSSGPRPLSSLSLIVLHATGTGDGEGARGVSQYFASEAAEGSTHLVVGPAGECFRCLEDSIEPWGAAGGDANARGLHLELVGLASFTVDDWLARPKQLRAAARHVALWCGSYGIPARFVDADGLRARARGVTTHAEVTRAFGVAGGHLDPGPGFPVRAFLTLV